MCHLHCLYICVCAAKKASNLALEKRKAIQKVMIDAEMGFRSIAQQNGMNEPSEHGAGDLLTLPFPSIGSPSKPLEKQAMVRRKGTEKSVLDDIMGDPDDFGDIGDSEGESDGGRWEDTLRETGQDVAGVEEALWNEIVEPKDALDKASQILVSKGNSKLSAAMLDSQHQPLHMKKEAQICPEMELYASTKEAGCLPTGSTSNGSAQHTAEQPKRYFIIKSLNHHNIEKSIQRGIWATQAMNEPILNEAFETAEKVLLIFSVNMSGHFQGYAQMVSPIGRRRASVWSEANWGGTFNVEWIRLYDLPFQKTVHLKNPLNSFKPVKISRDCQELTEEIGEALCALIDEGADREGNPKRKISLKGDCFIKKPCIERLPSGSGGFYRPAPIKGHMTSLVYPASFLHPVSHEPHYPQVSVRSSSNKYRGSSRSRSPMHFSSAKDLDQREERERSNGAGASLEEDLLNMSYEEYLQSHGNPMEYRYHHHGASGPASRQSLAQYGAGRIGNDGVDIFSDDQYANYLASWYANQQGSMMPNGCYYIDQTVANPYPGSSQPL